MAHSENEAASPEAQKRWPASTTFRCDAPEKLARFFFDQKLVRGFDIAGDNELRVQWLEAGRFYGDFNALLLDSGVQIYEVRSTASFLEKAVGAPHTP
jgi:ABC-2 type transport system ATP-binding protein